MQQPFLIVLRLKTQLNNLEMPVEYVVFVKIAFDISGYRQLIDDIAHVYIYVLTYVPCFESFFIQ